MKLRQSFVLGAAFAAGIFGLGAVGCGDDSAATGAGGSGTGGSSSQTEGAGAGDVVLATPPERPAGAPAGDGDGAFLGISKLYLGDTDRSGAASTTAWQKYGYDLDGQATVDGNDEGGTFDGNDLANHCTPVGGEVNAGNVEDGPGGVDNSFGKNILSFLSSILEDPSELASQAIEEGSFTIALNMSTLGTGSEYDPIPTNLYAGIGGEDGEWEYVNALLVGGDTENPVISFPFAYVVDNTWVSGEPQLITLNLSLSGIDLALDIENAVISVKLNGDRNGGTEGVISGVLDTESFVQELGEVASSVAGDTEGLCPGDQLFESIVQNIRSASDLLKDGSNKAGVNCDGISIAIGFDMNTVVFGEVAPDPEPGEPSNCE